MKDSTRIRIERRLKRGRTLGRIQSKDEPCIICGKNFSDCPHSWADIDSYAMAYKLMEIINE
jgi:hypothetical protein